MRRPEGSLKAAIPKTISPMLATLVDKPFSRADWLFELKWDGYRGVCFIEKGEIRFQSRNVHDLTFRFPELAGVSGSIDVGSAIIDGEVVALDSEGVPSFQALQGRFGFEGAT